VTVAFESQRNPTAYGVVANLSQGGACVWTDARLDVGQHLQLALSFAREAEPVPTQGRVVWANPLSNTRNRRCGVEWEAGPEPAGVRLKRLIAASA
jgi:Tfp pilus assembly protein PilZ